MKTHRVCATVAVALALFIGSVPAASAADAAVVAASAVAPARAMVVVVPAGIEVDFRDWLCRRFNVACD